MTDCKSPKCHEAIHLSLNKKAEKSCLNKMLPKKTIWAAIPILMVLFGVAIGAADFKYAQKSEIEGCKRKQAATKATLDHLSDDMKELKDIVTKGLAESRKDTKEILKYLRQP